MKLLIILRKYLLKKNFTITLISTTKSNFILSYPNKNYSLKLIFNIFKSNKNYSFKNNLSKNNSFKISSFKNNPEKINQTHGKV